jgi:hypothetical protein
LQGYIAIWILRHPVQCLSRPVQVWLTRVYTLKLNQSKKNWGKTRCFQAFFLDQDKPGAQGKKLAFGVKESVSGERFGSAAAA